jgi:uncharacterized membrane protein
MPSLSPSKIMVLACAVFFTHFLLLGITDHLGLRTQLFDLGHFDQALWQLTQGDLFMTASHPLPFHSRLTVHANFILYPLGILYSLFPSPLTLILLGVLSTSLAGYAIFLLAWKVTNQSWLALLLGCLFLISPAIHDIVLYDFHPEIFALFLLPLALLAAERRQPRLFWLTLILLLSLKEDMPLLMLFLTPLVIQRYSKHQGIAVFLIALGYWLSLRFVLPRLLSLPLATQHFSRLEPFGSTPETAVLSLLRQPLNGLQYIFAPEKLPYLTYLFSQGGFLVIFTPLASMLLIPPLAQNLLSNVFLQTQISGGYYSAIPILTILILAIYGFDFLLRRRPRLLPTAGFALTLAIGAASLFLSPAPYSLAMSWQDYAISPDNLRVISEIKKKIPASASLATQNNLGAHFSQRPKIFLLNDYPSQQPEFVLVHLSPPLRCDRPRFFTQQNYILLKQLAPFAQRLGYDTNYKLIFSQNSFYLFQRHNQASRDNPPPVYWQDLQNLQPLPPPC